jgi:hypothetical protein
MPEPVLVSRPAMIVETGEFNLLVDRVDKQDERLAAQEKRSDKLEHAMFGFQRSEDNTWVDGVLQNVADMRRLQAQLISLLVKVGIPTGLTMAFTSLALMIHSYGGDKAIGAFIQVLGAFIKGLLGIPIV